jgi:hypothetical protein
MNAEIAGAGSRAPDLPGWGDRRQRTGFRRDEAFGRTLGDIGCGWA